MSADDALDMLMSSGWGRPSVPRTGWFEFQRANGLGDVKGVFGFRDPLIPFEDCKLRQIESCVVSECVWIADEYGYGGSNDGNAKLAKLERFTLSSASGDRIEFDVNNPTTSSSARVSERGLEGGFPPPGGSWWGMFKGSVDDAFASVWDLTVEGGSLDGLSLSNFTLPKSSTLALPEGRGVNLAEDSVEVFISKGEDYQFFWSPSSDAEFFQVESLNGSLNTVQCFFDNEFGEGTLPAEVTRSFGLFALGEANIQVREFGEHLPRGKQALVVVSRANLTEVGSGKPIRLVAR